MKPFESRGESQQPHLTVWYGSMPETNGKTNWTAILHRKGECLSEGITLDRSEYPDRVRYEADRVRYLIGELTEEPDILAYDANAHSGYVSPNKDGWVGCMDSLPEQTEMVLAFSQGQVVPAFWNYVVCPIEYRKYRAFTYLNGSILENVSHWMPMPGAPNRG